VSDYLRFTPEEYQDLSDATRPLPLKGPLTTFRRALVDGLRPGSPSLADRIAGLTERQVSLLFAHLKGQRDSQGPRKGHSVEPEGQPACKLSYLEWKAIAEACAVIWLRDDSLPSFKGSLVQEVAEVEPALAAKLARLSEGEVALLYRQLKAGKRWCR
jgi:hypothetical protein